MNNEKDPIEEFQQQAEGLVVLIQRLQKEAARLDTSEILEYTHLFKILTKAVANQVSESAKHCTVCHLERRMTTVAIPTFGKPRIVPIPLSDVITLTMRTFGRSLCHRRCSK